MTFIRPGKNSNAKIIYLNPTETEGIETIHVLTNRQRTLLLSLCEYMRWKTRYSAIPTDLDTEFGLEKFADETQKRLIMTIDFCNEFINCITNDKDTKDALRAYLLNLFSNDPAFSNSGSGNGNDSQGHELTAGQANEDVGGLNPGCNQDKAYGMLTKLIDDSFQRIYDVFERIEAVTDNQEMLVEYVDLIPGIGLIADEIVISDAITFFDSVRSWMNEEFASEDTLEVRKEIVCDLFCIYQQGCKISINQIYTYFKERVQSETPYGTFVGTAVAIFNFLASGVTSFSGIMLVMLAAEYGFGTAIGDLFGISFGKFKLGNNIGEPSDDWLDDCDTCETITWCHRVNWDDFDQYLTISQGVKLETLLSSEILSAFDDFIFGIQLNWDLPFSHNITRIYIHQSGGENIEGKTVVNQFYSLTDVSNSILDGNTLPQQNGVWVSDDDSLVATTTRHINVQYVFRPASDVFESLTYMNWDYFVICGSGRSVFSNNYEFPA